ncbi:DET1- and DDB1-associated protein 1 [Cimex lectularius]|uniref:DET1- and DDB1-associated protein 1 n=1 Tax=Cimex lectularius TaxID=79782 RepID=A0A8I6RFF1_CIMLE|nr:DET1- and DDB1-associated protein 1 [Cimex lectularius]
MSVIAEFMTGLPSYDAENFSRYNSGARAPKRPSVYLTTKDIPAQQIIVTEKTNILLRYLSRKWSDKEDKSKKRQTDNAQTSPKKKRRLEDSP